MTYQKYHRRSDDLHRNDPPVHAFDAVRESRKTQTQRVEHLRQHTARQTYGEQTDVAQHVAQQTCYVVVRVPQACAEVDKRIAADVVQQQHEHQSHAYDGQECRRRGGKPRNYPILVQHRQTRREAACEQHEEPAQRAERRGKAEQLRFQIYVEYHTQHDLHHADSQRYREEVVLEVEESHSGQHCRYGHAEERVGIETECDGRRRAYDRQPCRLTHLLASLEEQTQTQRQQHQSVAGIGQTDCEEEHVEGSEEGREVHSAVLGQGVHRADHLEQTHEAVVLQLHGCVVVHRSVAFEVDDVGVLLQHAVYALRGIGLGPALHYHQLAVGFADGRSADLQALQTLLQLGGLVVDHIDRGGCTREYRVELPQTLFETLALPVESREVHCRELDLLRIDGDVGIGCGYDDEVYGRGRAVDLGYGIVGRPCVERLVEGRCLCREVSQHDAACGKRRRLIGRETSPRLDLVALLLYACDLLHQRRALGLRLHIGLEGLRSTGVGLGCGIEGVALDESAQIFDSLVVGVDIEQQASVLVRRLPARGRDIHQTQTAQLLDEVVGLRSVEHEVVTCHFRNHNSCPSVACCCC